MRPPIFLFGLAEKKDSAAPGIAGRRCRWQKKAARPLRSRALGGPSRNRPGKGICGKAAEPFLFSDKNEKRNGS